MSLIESDVIPLLLQIDRSFMISSGALDFRVSCSS